jgi:hypothetical protein
MQVTRNLNSIAPASGNEAGITLTVTVPVSDSMILKRLGVSDCEATRSRIRQRTQTGPPGRRAQAGPSVGPPQRLIVPRRQAVIRRGCRRRRSTGGELWPEPGPENRTGRPGSRMSSDLVQDGAIGGQSPAIIELEIWRIVGERRAVCF